MAKQLTGRQRSEAKRAITITNPSVCYYCKSTGLTSTDNFCPNCGFPQRGTQISMKRFINNIRNKHILLADQKKAISKARNILFALSGLFVLYAFVWAFADGEFSAVVLIAGLVISAIYLSLALWSRKHPFPAILSGFFFYTTLIVLMAIIDPASIFSGLMWKVIIIGAFYYGYKGVKDSEVLEKELEFIKKAKDLTIKDEMSEVPD